MNFIIAALPWMVIGFLGVVCIARFRIKRAGTKNNANSAEKQEKHETTDENENYMAVGMSIGMCIGVALGTVFEQLPMP